MDKLNQDQNNQSSTQGSNVKKKKSVLFTLKKLMKTPMNYNIIFGIASMDRKPQVVKKVINQLHINKDVFKFMKGIKSLELSPKMTIHSVFNTHE